MSAADPAVRVRGLRKSFDGDPILDGVDLDVPAGETTLLMGENGSGKTILLSCLAGGLRPTSGSVEVFGASVEGAADALSFALQGGLALPELSGRENAASTPTSTARPATGSESRTASASQRRSTSPYATTRAA